VRLSVMKKSSLVVLGALATAAVGQAAEPYPCDEATGVLAFPQFANPVCVNATSGGAVNEPVAINVAPTTVAVPEGQDVVDVFQVYDGEFIAPPALQYSSQYSWPAPTDPNSLVIREWVGNFSYDPPKAMPITYVNAPDPANEIKPAEFSWVLDGDGMAVGAKIEDRVFDALPTDILPQIERYHWQISGLPAGTEITYTKVVNGGVHVPAVPEPATPTLFGLASIGCLFSRIWRRR
ncbi:MAG: PEP-CTERM sorting domain-containing protein, partial [Planctomycetales bacterium]|nr:PEP-CTERM sorting domain-containing protein [Planctomycetales bacterium]